MMRAILQGSQVQHRLRIPSGQIEAVLLLLATLCFAGCSKQEKDARSEPQLVRTIAVQSARDDSQTYTGVVVARVQSDLGFRVAGKVTKTSGGRRAGQLALASA